MKNHLLSGIVTCNKNYPITEWDQILNQTEITLNLLQNSRVNPNISTWSLIH